MSPDLPSFLTSLTSLSQPPSPQTSPSPSRSLLIHSAFSEPLYAPSTITHNAGASTHRDTLVRDSEVALVPRTETIQCLEDRARALQGWRDEVWVERLRVQRYRKGGHYGGHFDWYVISRVFYGVVSRGEWNANAVGDVGAAGAGDGGG